MLLFWEALQYVWVPFCCSMNLDTFLLLSCVSALIALNFKHSDSANSWFVFPLLKALATVNTWSTCHSKESFFRTRCYMYYKNKTEHMVTSPSKDSLRVIQESRSINGCVTGALSSTSGSSPLWKGKSSAESARMRLKRVRSYFLQSSVHY